MLNSIIDLRSDTVTRPTAEMRAAMAAAEVGDDGVTAPFFDINWRVSASDYGVQTRHTSGSDFFSTL